jgi:carboxymethylenebutenolidase
VTTSQSKVEVVRLEAMDGAKVRAFVAHPMTPPKGCVIIAQEIFGVNDHIRWVLVEQYAKAGFLAVAPAFFDRIEENVELDYSPAGGARGRALVEQLGMDAPVRDIRAAQDQLGQSLRVAVVGFCWGGSVAYLCATRLGLPAVSFYGARTMPFLHERLQAPLMLHFGTLDKLITAEAVQKTVREQPAAECFTYQADHGFNRFGHGSWNESSAALALKRTLEFCERHATGAASPK